MKQATYILTVCCLVWACQFAEAQRPDSLPAAAVLPPGHEQEQRLPIADALREHWGVEALSMRLSAADSLLDFRFRVVDPDKAAPLFVRKSQPYLLEQASGAKFLVPSSPKIGAMRPSKQAKDHRTYVMLFGNPGRFVKAGSLVTVVIGDFKAENLLVQ